jgi:hypothetical protein
VSPRGSRALLPQPSQRTGCATCRSLDQIQIGSGQSFNRTYGGDLRQCGQGCDRLRPDGTIVPRNAFYGAPIHRVDLRMQQRVPLGGRVTLDGMLEVYNLFNHENYGNYEVRESNANYGQPIPILSLAYQPRMLQLGFRATF